MSSFFLFNFERKLEWRWRGRYFAAKPGEVRHLKSILEHEAVDLKSVKLTEWQLGSVNQNSNCFYFSHEDRDNCF